MGLCVFWFNLIFVLLSTGNCVQSYRHLNSFAIFMDSRLHNQPTIQINILRARKLSYLIARSLKCTNPCFLSGGNMSYCISLKFSFRTDNPLLCLSEEFLRENVTNPILKLGKLENKKKQKNRKIYTIHTTYITPH